MFKNNNALSKYILTSTVEFEKTTKLNSESHVNSTAPQIKD
jgi:hypothetical protein